MDEPLLLATLCHLLIYLLPYAIGLLVILLVDTASEQADLVVGVLVAAIVTTTAAFVIAALLGLGQTKLLGALLDGGRDLLFAGAVARRSQVRSGGEADSTSPDTCDIVLRRRLAQEVSTAGHCVDGMVKPALFWQEAAGMRLRRTPGIKSSSGRSETEPHADWLARSEFGKQSTGVQRTLMAC